MHNIVVQRNAKSTLVAILSAGLIAFSTPGAAQLLEEILVTANKREQSLQDVGISVTAFSGDQLRELGFTNSMQLQEQVPGLLINGYGGGATTVFTIRGSGQLDFGDQQESPVAVYIDGVYNSYISGVAFNFFDLERVEVLRGSQGSLFGRNATGGLVHVISAEPTREGEGYAEFTAAEYDSVRFEGAISGPLTETLSGRLAMSYEDNDSYMTDRGPNDAGLDTNNLSGRAKLLFEPNADLAILASARYSKDDTNGDALHHRPLLTDLTGVDGLPGEGEVLVSSGQQHVDWCNIEGGPIFGMFVSPVLGASNCMGYIEPNDGPYKMETDTQGHFRRDTYGLTGRVEWNLGWGELVSISDWMHFKKAYLEDADATPLPLFDSTQDLDSDQYSQELRISGETARTRWVGGLYYLNIDSDFYNRVDFSNAFGPLIESDFQLETTTYALFGQGEYDLNETWTVIAGLRWTEDSKEYSADNKACAPPFGLPCPPNAETASIILGGLVAGDGVPNTKRSEGDWSGNLEFDWHPNDDLLVYGKVSRGHKAGGFNAPLPGFYALDKVNYGAENPITYESGFKSTLFGGLARLNVSIFYTDYKDFQTFTQRGPELLLFNIDAEITNGGGPVKTTASAQRSPDGNR